MFTKEGEFFTFGAGLCGQLGHGGNNDEWRPRLVEAVVGKMVGASAGHEHTVVWADAGEAFTFERGIGGALRHNGEGSESVPRLVD